MDTFKSKVHMRYAQRADMAEYVQNVKTKWFSFDPFAMFKNAKHGAGVVEEYIVLTDGKLTGFRAEVRESVKRSWEKICLRAAVDDGFFSVIRSGAL